MPVCGIVLTSKYRIIRRHSPNVPATLTIGCKIGAVSRSASYLGSKYFMGHGADGEGLDELLFFPPLVWHIRGLMQVLGEDVFKIFNCVSCFSTILWVSNPPFHDMIHRMPSAQNKVQFM